MPQSDVAGTLAADLGMEDDEVIQKARLSAVFLPPDVEGPVQGEVLLTAGQLLWAEEAAAHSVAFHEHQVPVHLG